MEAKIRESVDRVRREGVRIIDKRWGVVRGRSWEAHDIGDGPCCCPLGAVVICSPEATSYVLDTALRQVLDVSAEWMDGFFTAFDGAVRSDMEFTSHDQSVGFALGAQLRHDYITHREATDG